MLNLHYGITASLAVLWLASIFLAFTNNIDAAALRFAVSGVVTGLFALTVSIVGLMKY